MFENVQSSALRNVLGFFQNFGLLDFILPFALIFILFFAVLQKIRIFTTTKLDKDKKAIVVADRKINGVLSLMMAGLIAVPHAIGMYPADIDPFVLIMKFLPQSGVLLVAILGILLLLGLSTEKISTPLTWVVGLIAAGLLVLVFFGNVLPDWFNLHFLDDPAMQALLIIILSMLAVGIFVLREKKDSDIPKTLGDWIKERK